MLHDTATLRASQGFRRAIGVRALLSLGGVLVVALAFWGARHLGEDALEALFAGLGILVLLIVGLWLFREGLHELLDHRALRRLDEGRPRRRGAWVAVNGRAVALDNEIEATLSQRPALACSYKVFDDVRSRRVGERTESRFLFLRLEGYHLAPTGIETDAGTVRLRALPDLVNLEKSGVGSPGRLAERARELPRIFPRFAARAQLATLIRDRFDVDWRWRHPFDDREHDTKCKEWVLPPDEQVCVFGRWDDGALIPSPLRPRGLPVYQGRPGEVRFTLGGGFKVFFVLAAAAFLGAAWVGYSYLG